MIIFTAPGHYLSPLHTISDVAFLITGILALACAGIVSYRYFLRQRERSETRRAFNQFVPPNLIRQVTQMPALQGLEGGEKELTVFFSDIRGFTTTSEGLPPKALVDILHEYLSEMTEIIFKHTGTLDKYVGDAIIAFWGAPYPQEDHALRASRAALEMHQAVVKLQRHWQAQGLPCIDVDMGINTGTMWVGNLGSTRRRTFTIVGANVNMAARLMAIAKTYGTHLIIGENTYEAVRHEMLARELDFINIKGRSKPVRVFELLGTVAQADQYRGRIDRFHQGLEAFRAENWTAALTIFQALASDYPDDGPSRVFIKRCGDLHHSSQTD